MNAHRPIDTVSNCHYFMDSNTDAFGNFVPDRKIGVPLCQCGEVIPSDGYCQGCDVLHLDIASMTTSVEGDPMRRVA